MSFSQKVNFKTQKLGFHVFAIYFFNLRAIKPIFGQNEVHRVAKKFERHFFEFLIFFKMAVIFAQKYQKYGQFCLKMAAILKKIKKSKKCLSNFFATLCTSFWPNMGFIALKLKKKITKTWNPNFRVLKFIIWQKWQIFGTYTFEKSKIFKTN